MPQNIVLEKSIEFSLECIKLHQLLQKDGEYIVSKQMLRSATSIGANITEATAAQSKKDFYAKICVAYKEAHETQYWFTLLDRSDLTKISLEHYQKLCDEIIRLLAKTKLTTETNLNNP